MLWGVIGDPWGMPGAPHGSTQPRGSLFLMILEVPFEHSGAALGLGGNSDGEDALYDQAVAIVLKDRKCSTSYIQRKLAIGYNKAARLVEQMEDEGLVTAANHVGKREILLPEQQ